MLVYHRALYRDVHVIENKQILFVQASKKKGQTSLSQLETRAGLRVDGHPTEPVAVKGEQREGELIHSTNNEHLGWCVTEATPTCCSHLWVNSR